MKPKLLVFASGSANGGGSGFEKLVEASKNGDLNAEIITVVSNHENGGVRQRADKLGIPFIHFPKPWTGKRYQQISCITNADFFALSGWLKLVSGLDPKTKFNSKTVFNIHPGPLPEFGGQGLYGHHVHKAVVEAFESGKIEHTAVCMHFVTEEFDLGPIFFKKKIKLYPDMDAVSVGHIVNTYEHLYQPEITNLVVNGLIHWDGINPDSIQVPAGYSIEI